MILGIHTELFEDQKNRKILYVKTTGTYYVVEKKKESFVRFLQTNIINAISLSLIIGMFFQWTPIIYAAVAAAIYLGYLFYFNKQVFPSLQALRDKNIKRKEAKAQGFGQLMFQAAAFLLIGAGLIYCVATHQVDPGVMQLAVMVGTVISFAFGLKTLMQALKTM